MSRGASIVPLLLAFASSAATHKPDLVSEAHWASDIFLTDTRVSYTQVATNFEWTVGIAYGSIDLEYRPSAFDALTRPTELHRNRYSVDLELRPRISEPVMLLLSANYYYGFTDYRSLWLDEFYQQAHEGLPGYRKAYPHGYSAGIGTRWEYILGAGFLEAAVSYAEDDVAPGYELITEPSPQVLRAPGSINKVGVSISSENVVAPFLRILNEVAASDSSERDPRFNYQFSANVALGRRFVFRPQAGYSREEPKFKAWYGGGALEFEVTDSLQVFTRATYYYDTGEVLDSQAISGAPPEIETYHFGLGMRYAWPAAILQIYAGPYLTRYGVIQPGTELHSNLYRDRNWAVAQMAFSVQF